MKITFKKVLAALLALTLVLSTVVIAVNAAADPYIKVSTIANVEVGSKNQEITVSLSPNTTLDKLTKMVLKYDTKSLTNVTVTFGTDISTSGNQEVKDNKIILSAGEVKNTTASEKVLFTIKFDFAAAAKGAVVLELLTTGDDNFDASINGAAFAAANVIGQKDANTEKNYEVYTDLVGAGLAGYIDNAKTTAPYTTAKIVVTVKPYEGSSMTAVPDFEIILTKDNKAAIQGQNVMTASEISTFISSQSAAVLEKIKAAGNTELTMDDFTVDTATVTFNGAAITAATKYVWSTDTTCKDNVYKVTLNQMKKGAATINCIFRTAMDPSYYHGSDVPAYNGIAFPMPVYIDKPIYTQETVLKYMKEVVDLYNEFNGDLDTNDDGKDDLSVDGIMINQHIKDSTDGKYDLGDFVLNETVVTFNNAKITDGVTFSFDETKNVYTVYFDQVNVPEEVLMAISTNLGKIDFTQFANLGVTIINESIGAFQAFAKSLVDAKWPTKDEVAGTDTAKPTDDTKSPSTGEGSYLGGAIIVALALSATAAVIIRKKEEI